MEDEAHAQLARGACTPGRAEDRESVRFGYASACVEHESAIIVNYDRKTISRRQWHILWKLMS